MKIGYARVSTEDQNLDLQLEALRAAGCARIYEEKLSGATRSRPVLRTTLRSLRRNDTVVVWKLDRLGRSLQDLLGILTTLEHRGIGFCSLSDGFDTTTPTGRLLFQVTGAFAEFERVLISERTKAGMQAARSRGQRIGRPRRLSAEQIEHARFLKSSERLSVAAIARRMAVGKTTVWRAVAGATPESATGTVPPNSPCRPRR
jgi:DNA invertase Pin-like site-specific DNA recombinase